jgi:hypothetical protein
VADLIGKSELCGKLDNGNTVYSRFQFEVKIRADKSGFAAVMFSPMFDYASDQTIIRNITRKALCYEIDQEVFYSKLTFNAVKNDNRPQNLKFPLNPAAATS